jgi:hypothetical protein
VADGWNGEGDRFLRGFEAEAVGLDCLQVVAASDKEDVVAMLEEAGADGATDGAGSVDDETHP